MSLFGNKNESQVSAQQMSNTSNQINKGTTITGDIETFGNFRLDGKLVGNIRSKSRVVLGKEAQIEGNIYAQNAEIEGDVTGVVEVSETLILRATATVKGDIITNKLTVDAGAVFNGKCRMGESSVAKTSKPVNTEKGARQNRGKQAVASA